MTPLLSHKSIEIIPDTKRPDKVWCFDTKGSFAVFNAISGKIEKPWTSLNITNNNTANDVGGNMIFSQCVENNESNFFCVCVGLSKTKIIGYKLVSTTQTVEGIFEIQVNDLLPSVTQVYTIKMHPTRSDLIGVSTDSGVLIIKVSPDHWAPQWKLISLTEDGDSVDSLKTFRDIDKISICWGPEEIDPISEEYEWKLVLIEKESKKMRLYTVKL